MTSPVVAPAPRRPFDLLSSLSVRAMLALALGLAAGAAGQAWGLPGGDATAGFLAAVGALWLNALKMTIVPLVFSMLVTGIASLADAARTGRLAGKAIGLFAILITGTTLYAVLAAYGLLAIWPIDPEGGARLMAGAPPATEVATGAGQFGEFLRTIAPANPIRAAAEDAILGLVVFAVFFGFAATRLPDRLRLPMVVFFEAVGETMIVIVRWVLVAAPIGVFAMAMGVGLTAGIGAAGTLLHYMAVVSLAVIGSILVCYPLAVLFGKISLPAFARGVAPAQVVAFSTQSSLASLPVMVERAVDALGVQRSTAGLVLPLAVAVFRLTSPIANLAVVIYCAHLFGVEPTMSQILAGMFTAVLVSVASVGLPGQVSFFVAIAPICIAMGVPITLLPIFLAVEVIPDIFRTVGNVTGDLLAARVVQAGEARPEGDPGI